jgi:hypothetical protein
MKESVKYESAIRHSAAHVISVLSSLAAQVAQHVDSTSGDEKKANSAFLTRLKKAQACLEVKV